MAAYDVLLSLIKDYLEELGYNRIFIDEEISPKNYSELISIRLANANVTLRNKTDKSSHQTHIAVTGEAVDFFYNEQEFRELGTDIVEKRNMYVLQSNLSYLRGLDVRLQDTCDFVKEEGVYTVGKRTQKQVQLSKRNTENSACFNELRLGLFENDLLLLLKERESKKVFALGIPQVFYLDSIPNYADRYETNTFLRLPYRVNK